MKCFRIFPILAIASVLALCAAAAIAAAQPWRAAAEAQPVGTICAYLDAEGTKPIDSEGPQQVYDVDQVVSAVEQLGSASFIKSIRIELSADWNTKGAGRIVVGEGMTLYLNLHGHMLDRAKAGSYADKWYAEAKGEAVYVKKNGTLVVDGGTGDEAATSHPGTLEDDDRFWSYGEGGSDAIAGGLITGGACDDEHGSGGVSLAGDGAKAYLRNVTVAGNLTDQFDSSYGHGAGAALHGKGCYLELDNAKVCYNHAEGTGGGIYVRKDSSTVKLSNGSEVACNLGVLGGGGVYVDGNDCALSVDASKINGNSTHKSGGGVYFNCKNGSVSLSGGSSLSGNSAEGNGGGVYDNYDGSTYTLKGKGTSLSNNTAGSYGGGLYLNDVTTFKMEGSAKLSGNSAEDAGGVYVGDSGTSISLAGSSEISGNKATDGDGGGIYHNGSGGSITLSDSARISKNNANDAGGGIYDNYNNTAITLNDNSAIASNIAGKGGGGGAYLNDVASVTLNGSSSISGNSCRGRGGALYVNDDGCSITLSGSSQMSNNTAYFGGAVFNDDSSTKLVLKDSSSLSKNHAYQQGGAIYSVGSMRVTGAGTATKITSNIALGYGGGIWSNADLYLTDLAVERSTYEYGAFNNVDVFQTCDEDSTTKFELNGVMSIGNLRFDRTSETITGGTLEKGSHVCIYSEGNSDWKIAGADLCSKVSSDYKNVVVALGSERKAELRSDGLYLVHDAGALTLTLYGEGGTLLDTRAVETGDLVYWDSSSYVNDSGQQPAWWDVKGMSSATKFYPDASGYVRFFAESDNVVATAHYANTHTYTLAYGDGKTYSRQIGEGVAVTLTGSEYVKGNARPAYWEVSGNGKTWVITANRSTGNASFTMPDYDVSLTAKYPDAVSTIDLTIGESTSWDDMPTSSIGASGATANRIVLTDTQGVSSEPTAEQISSNLSFVTRTSEAGTGESVDRQTKKVVYRVVMTADLFASNNMALPSDNEFAKVAAKVSFAESGTQDAEVEAKVSGNTVILEVSAVYQKKSSEGARAVVVKSVSSNDTGKVIASSGYQLAADSSLKIPAPEVSGWSFCAWDTSSLPKEATLDEDSGELTVSGLSADVEVCALFKPLASELKVETVPLEVGKAFPSSLSSCKVVAEGDLDITDKANDGVSVTWKKADGSAVGDVVEADEEYRASLVFKYSDDGSEFAWGSDVFAVVNDEEPVSFKWDSSACTVTLAYDAAASIDARYDAVSEGELTPVVLAADGDYKSYLPATITYSLKNGMVCSASVTWSDTTVPDEGADGFTVSGSFDDVYGASHEVSRSFALSAFNAPVPSIKAGTYVGGRTVELLKDATWERADEVKVYYAVGAADAADSTGLEFAEYADALTVDKSCTVFAYAVLGERTTDIAAYRFTIKDVHAPAVVGGQAFDTRGNAISSAAAGQIIRLLAADESSDGRAFKKWVVNGDAALDMTDASKATTSFTMPDESIELIATYVDSADPQPDPQPDPKPAARTVSYKGCTYTLSGKVLALTKVNKKSTRSVTVPAKIKINGRKVKVTKIKAKVFKGTRVKKLTVKSPYLAKKGVKNCLKSSRVKTVKVKAAAKKKANKKLVKKYRRCFAKANCGKKVKVK